MVSWSCLLRPLNNRSSTAAFAFVILIFVASAMPRIQVGSTETAGENSYSTSLFPKQTSRLPGAASTFGMPDLGRMHLPRFYGSSCDSAETLLQILRQQTQFQPITAHGAGGGLVRASSYRSPLEPSPRPAVFRRAIQRCVSPSIHRPRTISRITLRPARETVSSLTR